MEAFTYENIYYDDCSIRYSFKLPKPGSKRMKNPEYAFRFLSASGIIVCLVYIFFIKEISPLRKVTSDETKGYGFYERCIQIIYKSKCGLHTNWNNVLLRPSYVISIKDRSFKTKTACPVFPSLTPLNTRKKLILECDDRKGTIRYVTTGNTSDVFTIPFNDIYLTNCLSDVIDQCCLQNGAVVPSVVHYEWFSYKELGLFFFLRFMSVLRFIKSCLILMHGSYMPFGKFWDYFISIAPNVIHVKREHTISVSSHKLKFEEHLSDAMRIETLRAYGGIFLDYAEINLKPLTSLMKYEYTQVPKLIMAHKNAEFLRLWYKSCKDGNREDCGFNALIFRADLSKKIPDLILTEGYNLSQTS